VPFGIFLIAATAETNHPPFDLVEAEQELVGGFNTEYTGIRFAIFFLAEFMNVITMSAIATTLFLGGPSGPRSDSSRQRQLRERVVHADVLVHREGARAALRDGVAARVAARACATTS
jgi:NADH:ubiquinone oxidoreductase subunit H